MGGKCTKDHWEKITKYSFPQGNLFKRIVTDPKIYGDKSKKGKFRATIEANMEDHSVEVLLLIDEMRYN